MGRVKFLVYTLAGTTIWNILLIGAGYYLGANFDELEAYTGPVAVASGVLILLVYGWRVMTWKPRG